MTSLNGYALVTGAASGIGKATAVAYAKANCAGICIADINGVGLESTAFECQDVATHPDFKILSKVVNVCDEDAVFNMVKEAHETFGRLDYAANIAGIIEARKWPENPFVEMATETFDRIHDVNVRGVLHCLKAEIIYMSKQKALIALPGRPEARGSIVNMASVAGLTAHEGFSAYSTSKHAVIGLTRNAAVCHTKNGIRINAVCPGYVVTPLFDPNAPEYAIEKYRNACHMRRYGAPEEIADVVIFLTGPQSSFVTGADWAVDGGTCIR